MFKRLRGWWLSGTTTAQPEGVQTAQPGSGSNSPVNVTEDSAMQQSSVFRCVRILTETMGSLKIKLYERKNGQLVEVEYEPGNGLWNVLTHSPNRWQTPQEWKESLFMNLVLHGNAFNKIERSESGKITGLIPIAAQHMTVSLEAGEPVYTCVSPNGDVSFIAQENMWHCKIPGNGIMGLSPLAYAKGSVGLSSASEKYCSEFFAKGGKPAGVITTDGQLSTEARKAVYKMYNVNSTEGISDQKHQNMILENGFKYQAIQNNPDDMQMVETRVFQIEEVARFFGVPNFLMNSADKTTTWGSGLSEILTGFYSLTVRPYLTRVEQGCEKHLMTAREREKYVVKFDFDELLKTDPKARAEIDCKELSAGILTANEIRKKRGLPPKEGGDELIVNGGFVRMDQIGKDSIKKQE
ncbi:MAG TPA: phage portal protein [Flavobacteriales bacterium]|nr:phage portal protein [Methylococcaceae bacterium]HHZ97633.1 phage portal protein [Flavobacteriales bacterium]